MEIVRSKEVRERWRYYRRAKKGQIPRDAADILKREKIAARHAALARGDGLFYISVPCRNGHIGPWNARANYCVACIANNNKKWLAKNRDRETEKKRNYHVKNKERQKEANRIWDAANRDKVNAVERNRRARKKAAIGSHTAQDILDIRAMQNDRCAYCRSCVKGKKGHVDHIMPLALRGRNSRDNLQILCKLCNSSKGAKHPVIFAQHIGRLI